MPEFVSVRGDVVVESYKLHIVLKHYKTSIGRPDEVTAARKPILRYQWEGQKAQ